MLHRPQAFLTELTIGGAGLASLILVMRFAAFLSFKGAMQAITPSSRHGDHWIKLHVTCVQSVWNDACILEGIVSPEICSQLSSPEQVKEKCARPKGSLAVSLPALFTLG